MEIYGYIASIFMGLSLGMIGGGGSILTVPILVYLFHLDPVLATVYSLFIVGMVALVGGLSYMKRGEVDLKTGIIYAIPSFIGVYLVRSYLLPHMPAVLFTFGSWTVSKALMIMLVFSVLMLLASLKMIRSKNILIAHHEDSAMKRTVQISVKGFFVGCVTGFVGAGGGFLIIPSLVLLVGLRMKKAVGTSLFIIATNTLLGFLNDLKRHATVDWHLLLSVSGIAVIGIFLGMTLSKKVDEKNLKKGFGYFVLLMGTFVLIDQIKKL